MFFGLFGKHDVTKPLWKSVPATKNAYNDDEDYKDKATSANTLKINDEDTVLVNPEFEAHKCNFIAGMFFAWIQPLFDRASALRKQHAAVEHDDLVPLAPLDYSRVIERQFIQAWNNYESMAKKKEMKRKKVKGSATSTTALPQDTLDGSSTNNNNNTNANDPTGTGNAVTEELAQVSKESQRRLRHSLLQVMGRRLVIAGFIKFINSGLQFSFPLLLNAILKFLEDVQAGDINVQRGSVKRYKGYWLSILLFLAIAAKAVTENSYFHRVYRCGWQSRIAISTAVYTKSLRLSSAARQQTTLGELVNLMQVDATKVEMFIPQIHVLWDGIFQIAGYMSILGSLIGWPCVAGLLVMILAGPVQGKIMAKLFQKNRTMVKFTDARVKTTNEALQGIRCVKLYTWEDKLTQIINESRQKELVTLRSMAYLRGFSRAYMTALPTVAAVVSFVVFAYGTNRSVSASTLFAAILAFDQLRFPLLFYPLALAQLAQAQVSLVRVANYLNLQDQTTKGYMRNDDSIVDSNDNTKVAVGEIFVDNATLYWSDPDVPIPKVKKDNDDEGSKKGKRNKKRRDKNKASMSSQTRSGSFNEEDDGNSSDNNSESRSLQTTGHSSYDDGLLHFPKPVVKEVQLHVKQGQLCGVIGRVGSGKSTLCSAVLNETVLEDGGSIRIAGKIAYVAQSAWILNRTLRDNILFGLPYDEKRYKRVLEVCQLEHDLTLLDNGDMTEIGENGINLSGGQKQRVSVARAAYSDADIIILDDPLSALDPEVAKKLFDECIVDFMRGRTRLLVTNQLQCLPLCDMVVVLGSHRVVEQGTYQDLVNHEGGEVSRLLNDLKQAAAQQQAETAQAMEEAAAATATSTSAAGADPTKAKVERAVLTKQAGGSSTKVSVEKDEKEKHLMTKEERNIGAVELAVYLKYIRAGGGYFLFSILYLAYILCAGINLMTNTWISLWTSDTSYEKRSQGFYLGWYGFSAVMLGVVTFFRSFALASFGVKASSRLHSSVLVSVLNAPMLFFDTTPTGRILSRFSKDMYSIDLELGDYFDSFLFMSLSVLVSIGTIVFATPWFGIAIVPLGVVYIRALNYFRDVSRETKRLESLSRSPVYAHFSETLGGLSTIRAYGESKRFIYDFEKIVDENTRAFYSNRSADRWLSVRLELIGAMVAGLSAIFSSNVIVNNAVTGTGSDSKFASLAGLSLSYAISITSLLNWVVRSFSQVEASMNSCERVIYYSENIPQEAARTSGDLEEKYNNDKKRSNRDTTKGKGKAKEELSLVRQDFQVANYAVASSNGKVEYPPADWPNKGTITLNNLKMRYRPDTPLVLKGLNITINGGERIGVVGRTGSGKSSLLLSLMRIVEPDLQDLTKASPTSSPDYQAPLVVDGIDALRIGLLDLRSKLGIIPQNPVLFSGTIRSNMDPFDDYTDEEIWIALERCGMKEAVLAMLPADQLLAPVAEYGDNLSQGQRQLLCLGRALLKQCRILLLDEATSSVDYETDREIQRTLRVAFAGSTVLTIAHRVNTIMDSDKILVMKDGVAAEFASPQELLNQSSEGGKESLFAEIVRHSQEENQ